MAISYMRSGDVKVPLWLKFEDIEEQAQIQLKNVAALPWVAHAAVMPDCHYGKGATVGSVIGMRGAVSPAAVGVDIGCGMGAVRTTLNADKVRRKAKQLFDQISRDIPVGFNSHDPSNEMRIDVQVIQDVRDLLQEFKSLTPEVQGDFVRAHDQLGTLGGGNHFIEVCEDTDGLVWLMLHSGSRWIGKTLAEIHMSKAIDLGHNIGLPDRALSVFLSGTPEMAAYRRDLFWAQRYAMANRKVMMDLLMQACVRMWPSCVSTFEVWCHHNYVAEELHYGEELIVTRKGAINADAGRYGIIPGAMGSKSYIVRGLGNPESLCSAPHGAGRKMSRGAAKRKFELEDLIRQTEGTYCRKDRDVIDEIPGAYKSIEKVIENSSELVEVVAELQPAIVCVKG